MSSLNDMNMHSASTKSIAVYTKLTAYMMRDMRGEEKKDAKQIAVAEERYGNDDRHT